MSARSVSLSTVSGDGGNAGGRICQKHQKQGGAKENRLQDGEGRIYFRRQWQPQPATKEQQEAAADVSRQLLAERRKERVMAEVEVERRPLPSGRQQEIGTGSAGVMEVELDMASAVDRAAPAGNFPFWRKKQMVQEKESRLLTRRIVQLGKRRQLQQVFDLLAYTRRECKPVSRISFNAAMAACVSCGDVDRAQELFDEMAASGGVGVDGISYGTLLKGLGQARRLDDAFELLERMEDGTAPGRPELTSVHLNLLINACAEAGDALRARGVLQRYRTLAGVGAAAPSVFTYNLLIKGYARSDNPLEAMRVMEEMELLGLPLQRHTYNSLILACIRGADLERALELLQQMKEDARAQACTDLLPDAITYTTLLKGLGEDGDLDGVKELVEEMKRSPACAMDRVAFTAAIDACIAAGSALDAVAMLEEMQGRVALGETHLRPRAHVFLSLMRAFASRGDFAHTCSLGERMLRESSGRVWAEDRAEAQELLLEAAVNAKEFAEGHRLLDSIVRASDGRPQFTERGNLTMVRLLVSTGFTSNHFAPTFLRPEVSVRAAVETVMLPPDHFLVVDCDQLLEEVAEKMEGIPRSRSLVAAAAEAAAEAGGEEEELVSASDLVIVIDSTETCVGSLQGHHLHCLLQQQQQQQQQEEPCSDLNPAVEAGGRGLLRVKDVMGPPPTAVARAASIAQAATILCREKKSEEKEKGGEAAQILVVVEGRGLGAEYGFARKSKAAEAMDTRLRGFITSHILFHAPPLCQ
eukprot:TRINITY_DN307_c0_g2_i1.p1 TRINITY_DN307_c0_g2~~TRINITY_DN307_c0_g2_i1.p1  ORF type:complete len:815 (+),score=290.51 TRINITY_DN307_c0_g2_i1:180-2447(+)